MRSLVFTNHPPTALAAANVAELRGRVHALPEALCCQRRPRRTRLPQLRRGACVESKQSRRLGLHASFMCCRNAAQACLFVPSLYVRRPLMVLSFLLFFFFWPFLLWLPGFYPITLGVLLVLLQQAGLRSEPQRGAAGVHPLLPRVESDQTPGAFLFMCLVDSLLSTYGARIDSL